MSDDGADADSALWSRLRSTTPARIGLGRAGNGLPTAAELPFRSAHAQARDAVHTPLDVPALAGELALLDLGEPVRVASRAVDRAEYLRRPDLGRLLAEPSRRAAAALRWPAVAAERPRLLVVVADGLSARAVSAHTVGLLRELLPALRPHHRIAAPVIASQARVALGDPIGAAAGADCVLVLIGERPGLSVTDSLGAYLTFAPRPGRTDAQRNCVSNIHPPDGLSYAQATRSIAALLAAIVELGESGVRVKDRSAAVAAASPSEPELG